MIAMEPVYKVPQITTTPRTTTSGLVQTYVKLHIIDVPLRYKYVCVEFIFVEYLSVISKKTTATH